MRIAFLTADPAVERLLPSRSDLHERAGAIIRKPPRNLRAREQFDRESAQAFRDLGADYVFATAYPYVLTEPMLEAFPERVIVTHEGDLTERRWIGPRPVFDALAGGATATRTSLFFAGPLVGFGPLLLVGPRYPAPAIVADAVKRGDHHTIESYAKLHRAWMRRDTPDLIRRAIEVLAAGTLQVVGDTVWIDGVPGPCRLGEGPDMCDENVQRGVPASCPFVSQKAEGGRRK